MTTRGEKAGAEPPSVELGTPIERVPGITSHHAGQLKQLGLTNLAKLIWHLPMRHECLEAEAPVKELVADRIVSTRGEITATRLAGKFGKQRFEAVLNDGTGRLDLVFFNMSFLREKIRPGARVRVQGKSKEFHGGLQLVNPRVWVLNADEAGGAPRAPAGPRDDEADAARAHNANLANIVAPNAQGARAPEGARANPNDGELTGAKDSLAKANSDDQTWRPVYPASEDVPSRVIERAMVRALPHALPLIEDHFGATFLAQHAMPSLREAYRMQHAPREESEVAASRRRLAYDELFLLQLGVQLRRAHLRESMRAPALKHNEGVDRAIRQRLPFTLTSGQGQVVEEIAKDLSRTVPTNRLIQGDVGSGKTAVALYAALMAVSSGHQAAVMAPTELLAEQHYASMGRMLEGSRVRLGLLTGSLPRAEREALLTSLKAGAIDLLIGTHALLTEGVDFASLAVAIIDEQHRFGVHQRAQLRANATDTSTTPHVLVMTATPIPRSVAMTLLGDLDVSTIRGLPAGRTPISTKVVEPRGRMEAYKWLARRIEAGDQAYIVAPAIGPEGATEELELLDVSDHASGPTGAGGAGGANVAGGANGAAKRPMLVNVAGLTKELENGPLSGVRIATLHGRMSRDTREAVMDRFRRGLIDVLIATTVIEVGVDVPNATVMVVEQADRFGLAQLHQLRGRVGRGSKASWCLLLSDDPTEQGQARLDVMTLTSDGFVLAEKDFELRGPGEIVGSKQSGLPPFRVADLARDLDLLQLARHDAAQWVRESPGLSRASDALIKRRLLKTYGAALGLADVG